MSNLMYKIVGNLPDGTEIDDTAKYSTNDNFEYNATYGMVSSFLSGKENHRFVIIDRGPFD